MKFFRQEQKPREIYLQSYVGPGIVSYSTVATECMAKLDFGGINLPINRQRRIYYENKILDDFGRSWFDMSPEVR